MAMPELEREKIFFERQEKRRDIDERNKMRLEARKQKRFVAPTKIPFSSYS